MKGSVLVVGAGAAGMRATAELLKQGFKVYLLETKPTIGGKMAQLDKVFPTNECSTCTILPRMLELTSDPNIVILAWCDLIGLEGGPGDLKAKIRKKPRYVNPMKCTACTDCFPACPVGGIPMEYNLGRGASKAISFYSPFPPRKAIINPDMCDQLVKGKCGDGDVPPCVEACKPEAIDFGQKPTEMEIEVGAVILATGADEMELTDVFGNSEAMDNPNVLTGLEYERLLSGLGPTGGIVKRDDGKAPGSVTWLVLDAESPIGLMSAVAQAMGTKEKDPECGVQVYHCEREEQKISYEDFIDQSSDLGVEFVRCEPDKGVSVAGGPDGAVHMTLEGPGGKKEIGSDMVVMVPPLIPPRGIRELGTGIGVDVDARGGIRTMAEDGRPGETSREGVFLCGTAGGSMGIDSSVVTACSAAANAAALLSEARDTETAPPPVREFRPVPPDEEPKTAAVICRCGANIAGLLDLDGLIEYTASLPGVKKVEATPFGCDGVVIKEMLGTGEYNRLVVGACSPKTHEPLFMQHTAGGGLNPHLMEIVNLRNHCTWVHSKDKDAALEKAKMLMKMGIARASLLEPLDDIGIPVTPGCLVVGGSPAGMECALRLAGMGHRVHLVVSNNDHESLEGHKDPAAPALLEKVAGEELITVHNESRMGRVEGFVGNYEAEIVTGGGVEKVKAGAIVVATRKNMEAGDDHAGFENDLMLQRGDRDFFIGALGILNPLDFNTEGVFMCGHARAPVEPGMDLVEGEAAASRAACILAKDRMVKSPRVSSVIDANCDGCAYCLEPCPAQALTLIEYQWEGAVKKTVEVNEAICKGCGICMATCPKLGILIRHFTPDQFNAMIDAFGEVV